MFHGPICNGAFGNERETPCITAGKSLYRIKVQTPGFALYWPKEK